MACRRCPLHATTLREGTASIKDCVCEGGYYLSPLTATCELCPIGVDCSMREGITLDDLPVQRGYWRPSAGSKDVRRCPDAGSGCQGARNTNICNATTSACRGGESPEGLCAETTSGPFCRLCNSSFTTGRTFFVASTSTHVAHCKVRELQGFEPLPASLLSSPRLSSPRLASPLLSSPLLSSPLHSTSTPLHLHSTHSRFLCSIRCEYSRVSRLLSAGERAIIAQYHRNVTSTRQIFRAQLGLGNVAQGSELMRSDYDYI